SSLHFSLMHSRPPSSTPFPYTTLFRSHLDMTDLAREARPSVGLAADHDRARDPGSDGQEQVVTGSAAGAEHGLGQATRAHVVAEDRKSTRLNSSHVKISYAVFCLKKKK